MDRIRRLWVSSSYLCAYAWVCAFDAFSRNWHFNWAHWRLTTDKINHIVFYQTGKGQQAINYKSIHLYQQYNSGRSLSSCWVWQAKVPWQQSHFFEVHNMELSTQKPVRTISTHCQHLLSTHWDLDGINCANDFIDCVTIVSSTLIWHFLQVIIDSPVSPWTTWLPLLFVVTITGFKQGYEDFLRHLSDREVNLQLIDVVRDGTIQVYTRESHVFKLCDKFVSFNDYFSKSNQKTSASVTC